MKTIEIKASIELINVLKNACRVEYLAIVSYDNKDCFCIYESPKRRFVFIPE